MAQPSKTLRDIECERIARERDPIGYAIKDHEREHHNGFLSWLGFSGVRPSRSCPPPPPRRK
jgi:hypothetical protein